MEGVRQERECRLKRCYECNRLQEQVWMLAYEQIWPLVVRSLKSNPSRCEPSVESHEEPSRQLAAGA